MLLSGAIEFLAIAGWFCAAALWRGRVRVGFWVASVLLMCLLVLGYLAPPRVTLRNLSAAPLTNVRLDGGGFRMRVPDVPAGKSVSVTARIPQGENSLRIELDTPAGPRSAALGYVESRGGYLLSVAVMPEIRVAVEQGFRWDGRGLLGSRRPRAPNVWIQGDAPAAGASVYVDGYPQGELQATEDGSLLTLHLPRGPHTLRVIKPGCGAVMGKIDVTSEKHVEEIRLAPPAP